MKKNRIRMYWLLLLTLMYTASFVLSVGESQARFETTLTENVVLASRTASGITSNCLVSDEDSPVTVLLGEISLDKETLVSFWLNSAGRNATGKLLWEVVDSGDSEGPSYAEYLDVFMYSGHDVIEQNTEIDLLANVPMKVSMGLKPTDLAKNLAHGPLKIIIRVTWGEEMWGTFQLWLPEVTAEKDETSVPETEIPAQTEPETEIEPEQNLPTDTEEENVPSEGTTDSDQDQADNAADAGEENTSDDKEPMAGPSDTETVPSANEETVITVPADQTTVEIPSDKDEDTAAVDEDQPNGSPETEENPDHPADNTVGNLTDSEENLDNPSEEKAEDGNLENGDTQEQPEENGDTQEPPLENGDTQEPSLENGENTGNETDTEGSPDLGEPEVPAETEPETTIPVEEEKPEKPIRLETISRFDPTGALPVELHLTPDVTAVRLGLYNVEEDSENSGWQEIELEPFQDFTKFSLDGGAGYYMLYEGSILELTMENMTSLTLLLDLGYTDFAEKSELKLAMEAYAGEELADFCTVETMADAQDAFLATILSREQLEAGEEVREEAREAADRDAIILNQYNALEILLPMEWQEMGVDYSLERLTMNDRHELAFIPVGMAAGSWDVEYTNEEDRHDVVIQTGTKLPQAGTYRLTIHWNYEETCFTQTQTTFFVNYSAQKDYQLSSSEVPQND